MKECKGEGRKMMNGDAYKERKEREMKDKCRAVNERVKNVKMAMQDDVKR